MYLCYLKNWKRRWFVLYRNELKYFSTRGDTQPLRIIKLEDATSAERDESAGKPFCFRCVRGMCCVCVNVRFHQPPPPLSTLPPFHPLFLSFPPSPSPHPLHLPPPTQHNLSFRLITCYRTFFMFASSESEADEWVEILNWKLVRE